LPRNIEIKARIESVESLIPMAAAIATEGPTEIVQDDTFFYCENGRLKLRAFSDQAGELIFYRRENEHGPKESFYLRSPTNDPQTLRELLWLAYGQAGRIKKQRTLYLAGRTRIHLDRVEGLGDFLELEVVLAAGEPNEVGIREAESLMAQLGIQKSQLIDGAYIDLPAADKAAFFAEPNRIALEGGLERRAASDLGLPTTIRYNRAISKERP
jgi:predicted adenylyl cyclase CyaB